MRRKVFILISALFISFSFLSNGSIALALETANQVGLNNASSYYFIQFNGDSNKIEINEDITLTLSGWTDESKSAVNSEIKLQTTNQTEEVILDVNDELNEIKINEESFHYHIVPSTLFKVEEVNSNNLTNQSTVIEKNENGTSKEEVKVIDEFGTVIENKGLIYYFTDENNQKVQISEEKYYALNSDTDLTNDVNSSENTNIINKDNSDLVPEGNSNPQVQTFSTIIPSVEYRTHVQDYGWLGKVSNGEMSGTEGKAKRLEAIEISLVNPTPYTGGITYTTHVQDYGWLTNVSNGEMSGTSGESKRLEAIQINLTGEMAQHFDVYYRVHAQDYGWLDWTKNGGSAGTQGLAKRLEAINIVLVEKGGQAPGPTSKPLIIDPQVVYSTHVQDYGWLNSVSNGKTSGTVGQAKRMEAIKISLNKVPYSGGVTYRTHVQDYGWLNNVSNGALSGTSGQSKRLEAIEISLTGEMAQYFDIYYRVHAQDYGWLDWAKNGGSSGTSGLAKRLESIQIVLVEKGGNAPGSTTNPFINANAYNYYNISLNNALNMQMKVSPQTDKYGNAPAYVNNQYIDFNGSIKENNVNLRTSPDLDVENVALMVEAGTLFKVLDANVTGDSVSGSTKWYKIDYNKQTLYVHSSQATVNLKIGQVNTDFVHIQAATNSASHIYGTVNKGSQLTILGESNGWYQVSYNYWRNATASDVEYYLNPNNFVNDTKERLQFMNLTKTTDVSVTTLNSFLKGKGILEGQGQAFIDAGRRYGINEVYLMAHTLLETGQGYSTLAQGVVYNGKTVYNMYGVGAVDSDPINQGAKTAYEKGWDTPYKAIVGGAAFIDNSYLGAGQNTLYEMRWNPQAMANAILTPRTDDGAAHQYATDIGWAFKQVSVMYDVYNIQPYNLFLEIPIYK